MDFLKLRALWRFTYFHIAEEAFQFLHEVMQLSQVLCVVILQDLGELDIFLELEIGFFQVDFKILIRYVASNPSGVKHVEKLNFFRW